MQLWEKGLWLESDGPEQRELKELLPVTTYEYVAQPDFRIYLEQALAEGKR